MFRKWNILNHSLIEFSLPYEKIEWLNYFDVVASTQLVH
tara:strand:+ start:530 stop:646 length:117 start_codon:yes stop_codon:yes gene_type:complete